MNEQDAGERFNRWGATERTENNTSRSVAGSDRLAGEIPVEDLPIGETPATLTGAPIFHDEPLALMRPDETPLSEPVIDKDAGGMSIPDVAPMKGTITPQAPIGMNAGPSSTLLHGEESVRFRSRWNEIQGQFVDEPRSAVQQADALVSEVVEQITQKYANEHGALKSQWNQGSDVSTEDLRKVLQQYRSFFGRLVD